MSNSFSKPGPVRSYAERADRLDLSFPVEFREEDGRTRGSCLNISASGLLARFQRPLELWTSGDLWCDTGATILELRVRIVRANDREIGMTFQFRNDLEREAVQSVVAFAAANTGLAGGRPPF